MAQDPIKLRRPGLRLAGWLIAGLAVLGVAIWWSFAGMRSPVPAPPMLAPPMLAPPVLAPPVAAVVPPSVPVAPTPQALKAPQAPSFDIVRVNPQGGAVVAGRAAPDSEVTLRQDGQIVGSGKTNAQGQFVVVPDQPLAAGGQALTLSSRSDGQADVAGTAPVLVVVPPGANAPAVAVLAPANAPATVLQGQASVLALGVVDYDAKGNIRLSGTAPAGSQLRLYIDGAAAGEVATNAAGSWAAIPAAEVAAGAHTLRLDRIGPDGKVAARVEVPFTRAPASAMGLTGGPAVVVQPGDSLWRIASRQYGQGLRYTEIFSANASQIRDPDLIYPGQILVVPDKPASASTSR